MVMQKVDLPLLLRQLVDYLQKERDTRKRIEKAFDDDTRKSSITILGASPTRKALERLYIFENLFK